MVHAILHCQKIVYLHFIMWMWVLIGVITGCGHATAARAGPGDSTSGQPLPEVTVTGKMDPRTLDRVINQFVQSHAKPSAIIGQVGRWREDVCPYVSGLQTAYDAFVSRQIINVARSVGAPTKAVGKKCDANVEVVFTPEPQALLDRIASEYRLFLGYYNVSEVKQVTTFSRPVQVWYMTGSRALDHQPPIQGGLLGSGDPNSEDFMPGLQIDSDQSSGLSSGGLGPSGYAGSRLTRGLRSEFMHVLVIADSKGVAKYSLGSISDYIALLSLTRIASQDTCSELPSILNLFAADCASQPMAITSADIAYLKALYGTNLDQNLNIEQGDMHVRMMRQIEGK